MVLVRVNRQEMLEEVSHEPIVHGFAERAFAESLGAADLREDGEGETGIKSLDDLRVERHIRLDSVSLEDVEVIFGSQARFIEIFRPSEDGGLVIIILCRDRLDGTFHVADFVKVTRKRFIHRASVHAIDL